MNCCLKKQYPDFKPGVLIRKGARSGFPFGTTTREEEIQAIMKEKEKSHEEILINWLKDRIPPEYIDPKKIEFFHEARDYGWELISILCYDTPKRPVRIS